MICNRSRIVITQCNGPPRRIKSCRYASGGPAARNGQDAFAEGEIESLYDQFPDRSGTREDALQYIQDRDRALLRDCESSITALNLKMSNIGEDLGKFNKPIEILPGHSFVAGELRYCGQAYNTRVQTTLESLGKVREYLRDLHYKPYPDIRQDRLDELEEFDQLDLHEKEKQIKELRNREAGVLIRVQDSLKEWTKEIASQSRSTEPEIKPGKGGPRLDRARNPFAKSRGMRREKARKVAALRSKAAQTMSTQGKKLQDAAQKIGADSRASSLEEKAKPAGWRTAANAVTKEAVKKRSGRSKTREDTSVKMPAENSKGDAAKTRSRAQKNEATVPADESAVPAPATETWGAILAASHFKGAKDMGAALRKGGQNLSMEQRVLDVLSKELPTAENTKLRQYKDLASHQKQESRNTVKHGMKWLAQDIVKTQDPEKRKPLEERLAMQAKLYFGIHKLDKFEERVKAKAEAEAKAKEKGAGSEEEDTSPHPPVEKFEKYIPVFRK